MGFSVSAGKVMMRSTSALTSSRTLRLSALRSSSTDDHADALGRGRGDLLDAVDALDGFLDPDADRLLDLGGRGAEVGHPDGDHVHLDLGKDLLLDGQRRSSGRRR